MLLREVKDWKRSTLVSANRDSVELETARGRVTDANPVRKAGDFSMELVDLMHLDPSLVHHDGAFKGELLFPSSWGAVVPNLRQADVAGTDCARMFAPEHVLLRDDLDDTVDSAALQRRLWGMFTVHYPHTLSLPQRDRIRWHLFPELRMESAQTQLALDDPAVPIEPPDLMQVTDLQQEQVARTLGEGHRVIHGAADSGKTTILIFRAQTGRSLFFATARTWRRALAHCCGHVALTSAFRCALSMVGAKTCWAAIGWRCQTHLGGDRLVTKRGLMPWSVPSRPASCRLANTPPC